MIMSEPLSMAQISSSLSTRTLCANDHPYNPRPISPTNPPLASNSSNCAAAGAYAGPPALFDLVKTNTCPFEFTATPATSPKFIPGGSLKKSGTESKGMSGTAAGADEGTDAIGSRPLLRIGAAAAGEARNAINARAAAGFLDVDATPAAKTVTR